MQTAVSRIPSLSVTLVYQLGGWGGGWNTELRISTITAVADVVLDLMLAAGVKTV